MFIKEKIKLTLRLRLFLLFSIITVTLLLGLLVILLMTGNITKGLDETEVFIKDEHEDISKHVVEFYGQLAAETVGLSRSISHSMEAELRNYNTNTTDINKHPELLEELITREYNQLLMYMQKSRSSGAFIILNATVNSKLPKWENSKTGLYLKNMEPNIVNSTNPNIYVYRGFPNIAYKNSLRLHSQWSMEFNISNAAYYNKIQEITDNNLKLNNLYYWSPPARFSDADEYVMICSAPLIDSKGNVFGVCGFDISSMLFKLLYMPDNSMYKRIFCMISPVKDNMLLANYSLLSGGYSARNAVDNNNLKILSAKSSLYQYKNNSASFVGYHDYIKLYPEKSMFSEDKWALSIMVPNEDFKDYIVKSNMKLIFICMSLIIAGIAASFLLSKYYIIPINKGFEIIKSNNINSKTNIEEIDDLIEFLSIKNKNPSRIKEGDSNSEILTEFLQNLSLLSPAERSVFDLYANNLKAKEIADNLFLSINTIKTHTKHIYSKLNITSKEELILYVEMLKEAGKFK